MAAVDVLRASSLFKGFTDTGLQILAGIASERSFPPGSPLFVENMVADYCLLIGEGTVKLTAKTPQGEDASLGEVGAGDALGALSLIHAGQRMCSATAASHVTAAEIRLADFQKLMAQKPQACLKLLMNIVSDFGGRLNENREQLKALLKK
ncbi:MAG: cyclic nucleotide-binding domain-containing protein [Myxococcaceae bacterium]|nr:cyclic nucleotide-binding domain-containing protein [Myxococcaceae bacterium]